MPSAGERFGPYSLIAPIGAGGMGEVWKAADTRLDRVVAIKFLPEGSAAELKGRFEQEARAASALQHPNIVAVYDVGEANGLHYIVSELVEGENLRAVLSNGAVPLKRTLDLAAQIADGMAAPHARGITHRDLKPENIMVTPEGRAKILDFGLAKRGTRQIKPTDSTLSFASEVGAILGTTNYMSPEQARSQDVDFRSDQFSFGIVLHELLTGAKPFQRDSGPQTMSAIIAEEAPTLPTSVPAPVRWVVERCLEKEPAQRYGATADLHRDLKRMREHLSDLSVSGAAAAAAPGPAPKRRYWLIGAAAIFGGREPGMDPLEVYPLLTEAESDSAPLFSPDGRSIAYLRAGAELWVRPLNSGAPTQLATGVGGKPAWSRDGNRICFPRRLELWCVSAAGGEPRKVLDDAGFGGVHFTPDGTGVVFRRPDSLWMSAPIGAEPKKLDSVRLPERTMEMYGYSPDGKRIAVRTITRDVWLVPVAGGEPEFIMKAAYFAWMPDSRHAVVISEMESSRAVYLIDTQSRAMRLLLRGSQRIFDLDVHPDGKQIAYASGDTDWDPVEFSMDGKRVRGFGLSTMMETSAAWSPVGDKFLYISFAGRTPAIWTRREDGSDAKLVHQGGSVAPAVPAFSPDGKRIAFWEPNELKTIPAGGGEAVGVTAVAEPVSNLCWGADNETIYYGTGPRLWKVSSLGGAPVKVAEGQLWRRAVCTPDGWKEGLLPEGVSPIGGVQVLGGSVFTLDVPQHEITEWDVVSKKPKRVTKLEVGPGERTNRFAVHPGGKRVVVQAGRPNYEIWIAENFAQPAPWWRRWFRHWDVPAPPELPPPPVE